MKFVLSLLTIMICGQAAFASGDRIGNGGGLWACYNRDSSLRSGILLDLFEAREQFQIIIPNGAGQTPLEILNARQTWLRANWPEFTSVLDPYISRVEQNLVMVDAGLVTVEDAWPKISPLAVDCYGGNWLYTQFANYTSDQKVLVNNTLWTSSLIPPISKAALLLHESVYLMLREQFGDQDSIRARQVNAILLSNLSVGEIKSRVESLLNTVYDGKAPRRRPTPIPPAPVPPTPPTPTGYVCSIKNTASDVYFSGISEMQIDAEFSARESCEGAGNKSYCDDKSLRCEPYMESGKFVCLAKNNASDRSYRGTGRNALEAEFNSIANCQSDGNRSYCTLLKCAGK